MDKQISLTDKYSRHVLLSKVQAAGQEKISHSHVLVIGAGGLGSACLLYLASAGVGHITLFDADEVDLSNLQRQIIHVESSVGNKKVQSAGEQMLARNSELSLTLYERNFAIEDADILKQVDVVIDCTDKLSSRQLINQLCVKYAKTLISGSAVRMEGQLIHFPMQSDQPCYACLTHHIQEPKITSREVGVFAPTVGTIGTMQAAEALKSILGLGPQHVSLVMYDALNLNFTSFKLSKNPNCPVCAVVER